jgi:uncharacterized membrane protein
VRTSATAYLAVIFSTRFLMNLFRQLPAVVHRAFAAAVILFFVTLPVLRATAHGDEPHEKKKADTTQPAPTAGHASPANSPTLSANPAQAAHRDATMSEFPSLHPLVVHFPIVLLIVAALTQLVGLFVLKRELGWVTLALVALGLVGAYVSGSYVHPHTTDNLTPRAARWLQEHETYAAYTLWLALAGTGLKAASLFLLRGRWWAEVAVFLVLGGAAGTVSLTAHHGAQLVHLEGVGPQGKYLERHGHGDHEHAE